MNYRNRILGALAVVLIASSAWAATPTPILTPAATQTPIAAASPSPGVKRDVGVSASYLKFYASGTASVNPSSIAEGNSGLYTISVPGSKTGDITHVELVLDNTQTGSNDLRRDCLFIAGSSITADGTLTFRFVNRDNGTIAQPCDRGDTTVSYVVTRPNPSP